MIRLLIWAFVAFYLLTGLYIAILPHDFYLSAPGAQATGPYNMHFVRDVGFAFITSSVAIGYGIFANEKPVMVFGSLWLLIHGPHPLGCPRDAARQRSIDRRGHCLHPRNRGLRSVPTLSSVVMMRWLLHRVFKAFDHVADYDWRDNRAIASFRRLDLCARLSLSLGPFRRSKLLPRGSVK